MICRRWLGVVLLVTAVPAAAQPVGVLIDGTRLNQAAVPTRFLLPNGALLTYPDVVLACSDLQTSGALHYNPSDASCQSIRQLAPPRLPDTLDLSSGVVVFDERTRESCVPGRCKVIAEGSVPGSGVPPAVSIDSFTATPASLTGGGITTLTWTTVFADSCTLSDDQGDAAPVAHSGNADRAVTVTTVFTLGCSNPTSSDLALLTVTVTSAPQADPGSASTAEDAPVTITLNGSDGDGDPLVFAIAAAPLDGNLGAIMPIDATSAEVVYTPALDFNGADGFTFTVNDGTSTSAPAQVQITVDPVNDPPTFTPGSDVVALEDTPVSQGWALDIVPGPSDEAGQVVTFQVVANSNPGLFADAPAIDAAGTLGFTPAPDVIGSAALDVVARDDGGGDDSSAPAALLIDVIAAADLAIDKSSGSFFTPAGGAVSYTIVVSNAGPSDVSQAAVLDLPPPRLGDVTWTCIPTGAASCAPSGTVLIDTSVDLPEGASVIFQLDATLLDVGNDPLTNEAEVTTPPGVLELAPVDNHDSDTDLVGLFSDGMESQEPD